MTKMKLGVDLAEDATPTNESGESPENTEEGAPESVEEKETPTDPHAEQEELDEGSDDLEQKPDESEESEEVEDAELERQVSGLEEERVKLLQEIRDLRGERRKLKEKELEVVEDKIDDIKVHPDDEKYLDALLKKKGVLTEAQAKDMQYNAVKDEILNKFLEDHPEYKPENDKNDRNWNKLNQELSIYRRPDNARDWENILARAHRTVRPAGDRTIETKRQKVKTAGVGSGGVQRSSSQTNSNPLSDAQKQHLRDGGWSDEEIADMER